MNVKNWGVLVGFILLALAAGVVGSLFTVSAIPIWYAELAKPALNPPAWVFGPVWTTLFVLMGVAAFLVWRRGTERRDVRVALGVFAVQLWLNALWSVIFFGLRNPGGALVEIVFLWFAILFMIVAFARVSRVAAWLLLPYILWVSFAAYLNLGIFALNA